MHEYRPTDEKHTFYLNAQHRRVAIFFNTVQHNCNRPFPFIGKQFFLYKYMNFQIDVSIVYSENILIRVDPFPRMA